ncbi:MAG: DHH family phosphoesterase [Ktedonobacterales bacterium]|nr:DHH family phosphoesterase [Ktedonobacterales bacterium]
MGKRWQLAHAPYARAELAGVAGVAPLQVQLLRHRAVADAQMRAWLAADPTLVSDPHALPDVDRAAAAIHAAIRAGQRLVIVGDCDVDGLTATAIIAQTLRVLGADLAPAIVSPRLDDGRGLTMATVGEVQRSGAHLCVTVDNGSASVDEVAALTAVGIDVIITDHHHLPTPPPAALALVNPQRADSHYPAPEISGAGVALQLARVLLGDLALTDARLTGSVELAGLGTLADVVRMGPENHTLVARAVAQMSQQPRPGLAALLQLLRIEGSVTPRDLAFGVSPRLNAAGRLGDPRVALELLTTDDPVRAAQLTEELDAINSERQRQTEAMVKTARDLAKDQLERGDPIIFVKHAAGDGWQMGMVGLAAGRLADDYGRLAVVVAENGANCRGSLRGPRGFDIGAVLAASDPPLGAAGGHAQAGGFSAPVAHLDALRAYLTRAYVAALGAQAAPTAPLMVDAELPLAAITSDRALLVMALAPFGAGFSEPTFVTTGVALSRVWGVGGSHTKLTARDGNDYRTFFWRRTLPTDVPQEARVDIVWQMPSRLRDYEMRHHPEALVVAIFPHEV